MILGVACTLCAANTDDTLAALRAMAARVMAAEGTQAPAPPPEAQPAASDLAMRAGLQQLLAQAEAAGQMGGGRAPPQASPQQLAMIRQMQQV